MIHEPGLLLLFYSPFISVQYMLGVDGGLSFLPNIPPSVL